MSYFNFFESCFLRCSYLKTNESIKMFWLLNTIFPNKLQFYYLVPLKYKILAFQTFCFGLIVQLLPFIIAGFPTNKLPHIWSMYQCWVEILRLGVGRYLVDYKNTPYFTDYSYLQSIWFAISSSYSRQNQFLSSFQYFKSFL